MNQPDRDAWTSLFSELAPPDVPLPPELAAAYTVFSCLKETETARVQLLHRKSDGAPFILKSSTDPIKSASLLSEYTLLRNLNASFLPRAIASFVHDGRRYLLRAYIPEDTLFDLVDRHGPMEQLEAVEILLPLCDIFYALHHNNPMLVHRDIKPQNIVRAPEGRLYLIDMDTVRSYDADGRADTLLLGTRETAAPEQFGYSQTDARSDIYGLGMLLIFLLTGGYDRNAALDGSVCPALRHIIRRCTAFDPARRYGGADVLKRRLLALRRRLVAGRKRSLGIAVLCGAAAALAVGTGLLLWNRPRETPVSFVSPEIGAAARTLLGKEPAAAVYPSELAKIKELTIYCGEVLYHYEEHVERYEAAYATQPDMGLQTAYRLTLDDLAYFTELHSLALVGMGVSDLSPLSGLPLTKASLCGNQITDIAPLAGCPSLSLLWLNDNPVEDLAPLAGLTNLTELHINRTRVTDLSPALRPGIIDFQCNGAPVSDYSPLFRAVTLRRLQLADVDAAVVASINERLTDLTKLQLYGSELTSFAQLRRLTGLTLLDVANCPITSLDGIEALQSMEYLCLDHTGITRIDALPSLPRLKTVELTRTPIADYSPLTACRGLKTILCDHGQAVKIGVLPFKRKVSVVDADL